MLNKISNFYSSIRNLQKGKNWYFIACHDNFTDESSLLEQIDNNKIIKDKIKKALKKDYHPLTDLFQNDYLFLNNSEFIQEKYNTNGWDTDCIISPDILTVDFMEIDDKELSKKSLNTNEKDKNEHRKMSCYTKKTPGKFLRNEILFPNTNIENKTLKEIITIAQKLSKG